MTAAVDLVVPVYGNWAVVEPCLRSLLAQTVPGRILVVDDRSPDDTPDRIAAAFPEVELIRAETNRGFAATCNAGISAGDAPLVVLVNSDTELAPDFVATVVAAFADADERVGSAAPLLRRPDGRIDSYGICADPTMAGFVRLHGAAEIGDEAALPALLGPYGAVAVYRRAALDEVGVLDPGIFMYGEELDLALRLRAAGWSCLPLPRSHGVHVGGGTSGVGSAKQIRLASFGRAYLLRAYRVLGSRHALRALLVEGVVVAGRILGGGGGPAIAGRFAGWRAGAAAARRERPVEGVDRGIGLLRSLRMRRADYWSGAES